MATPCCWSERRHVGALVDSAVGLSALGVTAGIWGWMLAWRVLDLPEEFLSQDHQHDVYRMALALLPATRFYRPRASPGHGVGHNKSPALRPADREASRRSSRHRERTSK